MMSASVLGPLTAYLVQEHRRTSALSRVFYTWRGWSRARSKEGARSIVSIVSDQLWQFAVEVAGTDEVSEDHICGRSVQAAHGLIYNAQLSIEEVREVLRLNSEPDDRFQSWVRICCSRFVEKFQHNPRDDWYNILNYY